MRMRSCCPGQCGHDHVQETNGYESDYDQGLAHKIGELGAEGKMANGAGYDKDQAENNGKEDELCGRKPFRYLRGIPERRWGLYHFILTWKSSPGLRQEQRRGLCS